MDGLSLEFELPVVSSQEVDSLDRSNSVRQLIYDCRRAWSRVPEGSNAIVIGPGPKRENWEQRGWETLDINPVYGAKYTADANHMSEVVSPGTYDYVYAEFITMSPEEGEPVSIRPHTTRDGRQIPAFEEKAVGQHALLREANRTLKVGGKLVIQTGLQSGANDVNHSFKDLPTATEYSTVLRSYGFKPVLEMVQDFSDPERAQQSIDVVWYAEKIKDLD